MMKKMFKRSLGVILGYLTTLGIFCIVDLKNNCYTFWQLNLLSIGLLLGVTLLFGIGVLIFWLFTDEWI